MNEIILLGAQRAVPALITAAGDQAARRFMEFFAANIRNPHTRRAYGRAVADFLAWCDDAGVRSTRHGAAVACGDLDRVADARALSPDRETAPGRDPASVRLAGHRPGRAGEPGRLGARPAHSESTGKTPVLEPEEARALIDSIDMTTPSGPTRPGADWVDGVFLRADRGGAGDEG